MYDNTQSNFHGTWDGKSLKLTFNHPRIKAMQAQPGMTIADIQREIPDAFRRTKINALLETLPWIRGDKSIGGDLPQIVTDATTPREIAEAVAEETEKVLSRLLGERTSPGEASRNAARYLPGPGMRRRNFAAEYTQFKGEPVLVEMPPVYYDRNGNRHVGEEAIQNAQEAELRAAAEAMEEKNREGQVSILSTQPEHLANKRQADTARVLLHLALLDRLDDRTLGHHLEYGNITPEQANMLRQLVLLLASETGKAFREAVALLDAQLGSAREELRIVAVERLLANLEDGLEVRMAVSIAILEAKIITRTPIEELATDLPGLPGYLLRQYINDIIELLEETINIFESYSFDPHFAPLSEEQKQAIREYEIMSGIETGYDDQTSLVLFVKAMKADLTTLKRLQQGDAPITPIGRDLALVGAFFSPGGRILGVLKWLKNLSGTKGKILKAGVHGQGSKAKVGGKARALLKMKEGRLGHNPQNPGRGSISNEALPHRKTKKLKKGQFIDDEPDIAKRAFADNGYDVQAKVTQNKIGKSGRTPDANVWGLPGTNGSVTVEFYTPTSSDLKNIIKGILGKRGQGPRILVDMRHGVVNNKNMGEVARNVFEKNTVHETKIEVIYFLEPNSNIVHIFTLL